MAQITRIGLPTQVRKAATPLCLIAFLSLSQTLYSQPAGVSLEYGVKGTYLLRFAQFIEWPPVATDAPGSPFNICILGTNPFGNAIDQIVNGESVDGRKVTVQKLDREPAPGMCQILFIGDKEASLPAQERGVLTVGEGEDFVRHGGMIGFVIDNRRVTFDINRRAAEAAGLKFRSGLLSVARSVIK